MIDDSTASWRHRRIPPYNTSSKRHWMIRYGRVFVALLSPILMCFQFSNRRDNTLNQNQRHHADTWVRYNHVQYVQLTYLLLYIGCTTSQEGSPKDCSNYRTIALISHVSNILLMILLNRVRQRFSRWHLRQCSRWPLRQRPDMVLAEVSWVWNMTEYIFLILILILI